LALAKEEERVFICLEASKNYVFDFLPVGSEEVFEFRRGADKSEAGV